MNSFIHRGKPRSRPAILLTVLAVAALAAGLARAALPDGHAIPDGQGVPEPIPYRGVLDQNGAPVTREAVPMDFALYTAVGATSPAWGESKSVNVVGGRFSVQLGDTTPIPSALLDGSDLYLAVTVDGQPLVGRQRLLTAPYAHRAGSAWTYRSRDISTELVPPGTIVAFGGATPPAGWLACDGTSLWAASYPALYAAIGTAWGSAGGGQFNLPDLRGRFPRGVDDGADRDPGRTLGTAQAFATNVDGIIAGGGWHDHSNKVNSEGVIPYAVRYEGGTGSVGVGSDYSPGEPNIYHYWKIDGGEHTHALLNGSTETRPMNVAVKYIIKY
jgi:hypothetical protein